MPKEVAQKRRKRNLSGAQFPDRYGKGKSHLRGYSGTISCHRTSRETCPGLWVPGTPPQVIPLGGFFRKKAKLLLAGQLNKGRQEAV